MRIVCFLTAMLASSLTALVATADEPGRLTLSWEENILTIHGAHLPSGALKVWYLEAYCRSGSTDRDWRETVIGHTTERVATSDDGRRLELKCRLTDGVVVTHRIEARGDEIDFRLRATNPTTRASAAHWAQPCIRVDRFTGLGQKDYVNRSFLFVDGRLAMMPLETWATQARYTPGQVWCPRSVDRDDVNPRPLSPLVPSNGLIGCFSGDKQLIMATAWEPYQELFQGVIVCLHSDFRIGGLEPGETKEIRGKIYLVPADIPALLERYEHDFPEHREPKSTPESRRK